MHARMHACKWMPILLKTLMEDKSGKVMMMEADNQWKPLNFICYVVYTKRERDRKRKCMPASRVGALRPLLGIAS